MLNIRFSKTLSEYKEQPYLLEKLTILFLDPPTKMRVTFVGYSWNNQGIFVYLIFPNIISEYSQEFHWELYPNIMGISHGNVPRLHVFFLYKHGVSKHIQAQVW